MAALLTRILASTLPLILASAALASEVPKLNVKPTCRAAAASSVTRPQEACLRDERQAQTTLEKQWKQYSGAEQNRCTSLTRLGGPPSYVELLTCLETAKEASKLPHDSGVKGPIER